MLLEDKVKYSYFSFGVSRLPNGSNCVDPEQKCKKNAEIWIEKCVPEKKEKNPRDSSDSS